MSNKKGESRLVADRILPAPDGESNCAYNAGVISALQKELFGPLEGRVVERIPRWVVVDVNDLVRRIANLRALHAEQAAEIEHLRARSK